MADLPTVTIDTVDQEIAGGATIQLAATTTNAVAWHWETGDVGTFSPSSEVEDPTWTAPAATAEDQPVEMSLTVTNADGATAFAGFVTITVLRAGAEAPPPTVTIDTVDQEIAGGADLVLAATSTDAISYLWEADPSVGTFSDTTAEDTTWTAPDATAEDQPVVLSLTVSNATASATATVTITVLAQITEPPPPPLPPSIVPPTVTIDTEDQEVAGSTVVRLAASSSNVVAYAWAADPAVGMFSDADIEAPTWTAPAATTEIQVIVLSLTVTGTGGDTATATVMITVQVQSVQRRKVVVEGAFPRYYFRVRQYGGQNTKITPV